MLSEEVKTVDVAAVDVSGMLQRVTELSFIETKHGKTRYILEGNLNSNHTLILIHGILPGCFTWNALSDSLIKQMNENKTLNEEHSIRILRYDLYGRGKSSNPKVDHNAELFVEQLKEVIDTLVFNNKTEDEETIKKGIRKQRISLCGFSMGGAIVNLFTFKFPDLVDDLVLFCPAGAKWNIPAITNIVKVPKLGDLLFGMASKMSSEEDRLEVNFYDLTISKEVIRRQIEDQKHENSSENDVSSLLNSFRHFPLRNCENEIKVNGKTGIRTLIAWALNDTTVPCDECFPVYYEAFKDNKEANFVIFNNTRHMFWAERLQDTTHLFLNFLSQNPELTANVQPQKEARTISGQTKQDKKKYKSFVNHPTYSNFMI
ncbi:hypothetical protein ABK040_008398 [Willaertia magna]